MSDKRMTVLVAGATGSIGRLVVEEATTKGHAVRVLARDLRRARRLFPDAAIVPNSGVAYGLSKRANHLRVQAASLAWGERGARVNCISPGIIATPMAQQEMAGPGGAGYRKMIETSASRRMGTPDDVAAAAAFLLGQESSFVTGADLLIDGGRHRGAPRRSLDTLRVRWYAHRHSRIRDFARLNRETS